MERLTTQLSRMSIHREIPNVDSLSQQLSRLSLGRPDTNINLPKIHKVANKLNNRYLLVGHSEYRLNLPFFSVKPNIFIIFLARPEILLPKTIVTPSYGLTRFLSRKENIDNLLESKIKNIPPILENWQARFFGPGDPCIDIELQLIDNQVIGTGLHKLPLGNPKQLLLKKGHLHGRTIKLSQLNSPGVYFVACCRKSVSVNQPSSRSIYTSVSELRSGIRSRVYDKSAMSSLRKRRFIKSPTLLRSIKKIRVQNIPKNTSNIR